MLGACIIAGTSVILPPALCSALKNLCFLSSSAIWIFADVPAVVACEGSLVSACVFCKRSCRADAASVLQRLTHTLHRGCSLDLLSIAIQSLEEMY